MRDDQSITLSDFVMTHTTEGKKISWMRFAAVTVTTRTFSFFGTAVKQERRPIARRCGSYWFFSDTGEICPDMQAESLERAWEAQRELESAVKVEDHR